MSIFIRLPQDGDYGVFAPLLQQDGLLENNTKQLARAAYFERNNNPVKARESLSTTFSAINKHEGPMSALFKKELQNRISWFRGQDRADWELELAKAYYKRRDYVRTVIFLFESFVTHAALKCEHDINDFNQREQAWKQEKSGKPQMHKLEYIRNALAHGIKPGDQETMSLINNEEHFVEWLQSRLTQADEYAQQRH